MGWRASSYRLPNYQYYLERSSMTCVTVGSQLGKGRCCQQGRQAPPCHPLTLHNNPEVPERGGDADGPTGARADPIGGGNHCRTTFKATSYPVGQPRHPTQLTKGESRENCSESYVRHQHGPAPSRNHAAHWSDEKCASCTVHVERASVSLREERRPIYPWL